MELMLGVQFFFFHYDLDWLIVDFLRVDTSFGTRSLFCVDKNGHGWRLELLYFLELEFGS